MFNETTNCRICNSNVKVIFNLGTQGLASVFPKKDEIDPVTVPLVLCQCDNEECKLVQLKHTVNSTELYEQEYGYCSGINQTMKNHLEGLVRSIEEENTLNDGDIVLDIGSNDATLLKFYNNKNLKRVGIDPTGSQFLKYYEDIDLYPTYFKSGIFEGKAKVITSISMFYDLPDPVQFMRDIKNTLSEDKGIWVMEQSYMPSMLKLNSYDTVCHEHLEYYTLNNINYMCKMVGLDIIHVDFNECNGGSFRVYISHPGCFTQDTKKINQIIQEEKDIDFEAFNKRCEESRTQLVSFLKIQKLMGKKIYIYGASTKGNTLLQYCGIDSTLIEAAAERNPNKYGCRTPVTGIPIISEAEMRSRNPDFLLVLPWHFRDEFVKRESEYLKNGGQIIFPLPQFEIIKE
jgi:NDP-4-keto-2,6-dideoxyhexose 3-C-methyltransferase